MREIKSTFCWHRNTSFEEFTNILVFSDFRVGRENAEKELSTRIAEMSTLEDRLRREC